MANRTHNNGELRICDVNKEVTLIGWVAKRRNFGALVFIDLRDRFGITQLVFDETITKSISDVRNEYILEVSGIVTERKDKNPKLAYNTIVPRDGRRWNTVIHRSQMKPLSGLMMRQKSPDFAESVETLSSFFS